MSSEPLLTVLSALERELHLPEVRRDRARLGELLHADFVEFGRSGTEYTRSEIVVLMPDEQTPARVHAQDFRARPLADGAALLTYRSAHVVDGGALERFALRSSVWVLGPSGWQMLFHQGTPTEAFARDGG